MSKPKRFRRWNWIVDSRAQLGSALQVMGILAGICLCTAVGVYLMKGEAALGAMSGMEVRVLLFKTTAAQFMIGAATLAILAIVLTHRFTGPAFALERALRESLEGKHDRVVRLRDRDYLRGLAKQVEAVRKRVKDHDALLVAIASRLDEGDLDGAREVLAEAGGSKPESGVAQDKLELANS